MTNENAMLRPNGTKRHGWQGILFYWICYLGAGLLGIGALVGLLEEAGEGMGAALGTSLLLLGVAAINFLLARGVQRFHPWARVFALLVSYASAAGGLLGALNATAGGERAGSLFSAAVAVVFIFYFHRAKDLFTEEGGSSLSNAGLGGQAISADG